jgi:ankyrin repeat protein
LILNKSISIKKSNIRFNIELFERALYTQNDYLILSIIDSIKIDNMMLDMILVKLIKKDLGHILNIFLDNNNIDPSYILFYGESLLTLSCDLGSKKCVTCLCQKGADINFQSLRKINRIIGSEILTRYSLKTPLMIAVCNDFKDIVDILIKNRVDLNKVDSLNKTALIYAISRGCFDIVSKLIENNVRLNYTNDHNICYLVYNLLYSVAANSNSNDNLIKNYFDIHHIIYRACLLDIYFDNYSGVNLKLVLKYPLYLLEYYLYKYSNYAILNDIYQLNDAFNKNFLLFKKTNFLKVSNLLRMSINNILNRRQFFNSDLINIIQGEDRYKDIIYKRLLNKIYFYDLAKIFASNLSTGYISISNLNQYDKLLISNLLKNLKLRDIDSISKIYLKYLFIIYFNNYIIIDKSFVSSFIEVVIENLQNYSDIALVFFMFKI